MSTLPRSPLPTLVALSILARLPLPMLSIGLLVHAARLTGSLAAAGVAVAVFAAAQSLGGPVLGRRVDRDGGARLLCASAAVSTVALAALAALPVGSPLLALGALAAVAGAAVPPVGACTRALLPGVVERDALAAAYVAEATASELAFLVGPMLALLIAGLVSTGTAIAATAVLLGGATFAFAAQPATRAWRPTVRARGDWAGPLRSPGLRTLIALFVLVGVLFGGVEVAVAAVGGAATAATTGVQLGLWAAGSLASGAVMTRLGRTPRGPVGLAATVAVLAAGHLLLAAVCGSPIALAAILVVAGAAISPTYATVNAMVERVAPAGTSTEAFAWLATAIGSGSAIGAAVAGLVAERGGAASAFLLAGGAAVVGLALVCARLDRLQAPELRAVRVA